MFNKNLVTCKADAKLVGVLTKNFEIQKLDDQECLCSSVAVKRFSGIEDIVPIFLPKDSVIDSQLFKTGDCVSIDGCICSFSKKKNGHFILSVCVTDIKLTNEEHKNEITVCGFLSTETSVRVTPKGRRIADLKVVVYRDTKNAYIPCIVWGKIADDCSQLSARTFIKCKGEFHSREYIKRYEDGTSETKTTYECSFRTLDIE